MKKKVAIVVSAFVVLLLLHAASRRQLRAQSQAAQAAQPTHDMSQMKQPDAQEPGMDHAVHAMSHKHMDMGPHMKMTDLRPLQPGDKEKAAAIVDQTRTTLEKYRDYKVALADGYRIFLPNLPQKMYHFTNYWYGFEAAFRLNPEHPTSLLYEKTADGGWKLIGAMYTAPAQATQEELNERIPLSIAQWHEHTNFCAAPKGHESEYLGSRARFGLAGSIVTEDQCNKAGGTFKPVIFGWMVHVYPFEKTPAEVWAVERQMDHSHAVTSIEPPCHPPGSHRPRELFRSQFLSWL
ncbi:MAG TPA: hypothetical protein VK473_08445 [Terriglobales bacterium]|nr:hypothetical protein [Terriglobales bacterium]